MLFTYLFYIISIAGDFVFRKIIVVSMLFFVCDTVCSGRRRSRKKQSVCAVEEKRRESKQNSSFSPLCVQGRRVRRKVLGITGLRIVFAEQQRLLQGHNDDLEAVKKQLAEDRRKGEEHTRVVQSQFGVYSEEVRKLRGECGRCVYQSSQIGEDVDSLRELMREQLQEARKERREADRRAQKLEEELQSLQGQLIQQQASVAAASISSKRANQSNRANEGYLREHRDSLDSHAHRLHELEKAVIEIDKFDVKKTQDIQEWGYAIEDRLAAIEEFLQKCNETS